MPRDRLAQRTQGRGGGRCAFLHRRLRRGPVGAVPAARALETTTPSYSYAVRTSATYECVSYGSDGNLKRTRSTALAYGTTFGYRRDGSDTLLLTNEHVADWPTVTDDDHPIDGITAGCKKIADSLKIVDDDHDDYAADDIPLSRAAVDPTLDVAVLRAHARLEIIPWKIGRSAALAARTPHGIEIAVTAPMNRRWSDDVARNGEPGPLAITAGGSRGSVAMAGIGTVWHHGERQRARRRRPMRIAPMKGSSLQKMLV